MFILERDAEFPRLRGKTLPGAVLVQEVTPDQTCEFEMDCLELQVDRLRGVRRRQWLAGFQCRHQPRHPVALGNELLEAEARLGEEGRIIAGALPLRDPQAHVADLRPQAVDRPAILSEVRQ